MAIYSVGRRRVILALILTSALLLTLDLRGNPAVDRARDVMAVVIDPIDSAVGVVASPVERAWNGIVNYNDLEQENEALQEEVDRLIGTQVSGEAAVLQAQEILALNNLPALAGIPTELAQVVGGAANNIDQIIEINKGRRSGIEVGMPVVNQAGLIGKVTSVTETSARVMLVTDPRYAVGVTVTAGPDQAATGDETVTTSPSGLTPEQISDATSTTTTSTTVPVGDPSAPTATVAAGSELPTGPPTPDTTLPGATTESVPSFIDPMTGEPIPAEVLTALAAQAEADAAAAAAAAARRPQPKRPPVSRRPPPNPSWCARNTGRSRVAAHGCCRRSDSCRTTRRSPNSRWATSWRPPAAPRAWRRPGSRSATSPTGRTGPARADRCSTWNSTLI